MAVKWIRSARQESDVDARTVRRLSVSAGLAVLLLGLVLATTSACAARQRGVAKPTPPARSYEAPPRATVEPVAPVAADPAPQPRQLPPLRGEPQVRVLLDRGDLVSVRLLSPGRSADGTHIAVGAQAVRRQGTGFTMTGARQGVAGPVAVIEFDGPGPHFKAGRNGHSFAGDLVLIQHEQGIAVAEQLGMEAYLRGVIEKEVEPDWPLEALKAQAVAARSYATAKWLERSDRPWQLDASEQVDMAYAGFVAKPHVRLQTAVKQTRGDLLIFANQPVPAFFHAASGGYTEDVTYVWPERRMPDGVTKPAPAMPAGRDPWSVRGEKVAPQRLGAWQFRISFTELATRLRKRGLDFGVITRIRIAEQDSASARARSVDITGSKHTGRISAHALRMACGSTKVKSTRWTSFRFSDTALVIDGRGYGHGVGMPQASAWAMARDGKLAPDILRQYYAGATLSRKW
ncbi:MAG: SpoIID/LytB domain-containing protein [Planctomycetota bacterium]|jgi:SpoIID/LytB domain protein|nr:SpoIID/LytB domain-containing protein [Planctomycetota bacterium]